MPKKLIFYVFRDLSFNSLKTLNGLFDHLIHLDEL